MRCVSVVAVVVLLSVLCVSSRAQMDDEYALYAVVDADDLDAFDIAQFGFGGAGFGGGGGYGGGAKGLSALPTVVQCSGKHGCLGGRGGHKGGGALNIIVGVPTPVPTPVPVPTYTPTATVQHVNYVPQVIQGKQQMQVPVTTKQQFQGQAYVQDYGKAAGGAYGAY